MEGGEEGWKGNGRIRVKEGGGKGKKGRREVGELE